MYRAIRGLAAAYAACEAAAAVAWWRVAVYPAWAIRGAGGPAMRALFFTMCGAYAKYEDYLPWRTLLFVRTPGTIAAWAALTALLATTFLHLTRRWTHHPTRGVP